MFPLAGFRISRGQTRRFAPSRADQRGTIAVGNVATARRLLLPKSAVMRLRRSLSASGKVSMATMANRPGVSRTTAAGNHPVAPVLLMRWAARFPSNAIAAA